MRNVTSLRFGVFLAGIWIVSGCNPSNLTESLPADADLGWNDATADLDAGDAHEHDADGTDSSRGDGDTRLPADGDPASADPGPNRCRTGTPPGALSLPRDEAIHPDVDMEWHYWTGHLRTEDGRWFGFESVFFRKLFYGLPARMAHAAITDITRGEFHHNVSIGFGDWTLVPNGYEFVMAEHMAVGSGGYDTLWAEIDNYELDLTTAPEKPAVLQHGDGYTDYPFGGYTYYFSRERMAAEGTVTVDGEVLPVTGTAWFDHQWGEMGGAVDLGWDWFALQLDDNRELMFYQVRDEESIVLQGGSSTNAACENTELDPDAFSIVATGEWLSPNTLCVYPSGWTIKVGDMTFTLTPLLDDQEMPTAYPMYWEGAALVSGSASGRAYVELTGYCP